MREKLITEGWRYFNLCGRYKNKTHDVAFTDFCIRIEELKMSQLNRELKEIKNDDDSDNDDLITRLTPRNIGDNIDITNINNDNVSEV